MLYVHMIGLKIPVNVLIGQLSLDSAQSTCTTDFVRRVTEIQTIFLRGGVGQWQHRYSWTQYFGVGNAVGVGCVKSNIFFFFSNGSKGGGRCM